MNTVNTSGIFIKKIFPFPKLVIISALALLLLNIQSSYSQLKDKTYNNMNKSKEFFFIDPLVFYSTDSSKARLDVYIEVPMENLQFKWDAAAKQYIASVDYEVAVTDSYNSVVVRDASTDVIKVSKQEHKQVVKTSEYIIKHYMLPTGNYELSLNIKDNNTQLEHNKNASFEIVEYTNKNVAMSDLMIISNYKSGEGKKTISPLVNNNIGSLQSFYLFFEVYNNNDHLVKKDFSYKITDEKNEEVVKGRFDYLLQPGVNQKIEKFSTKDLVIGDYQLEISDPVSSEVMALKKFDFKWDEMPTTIQDLDLAINQTMYLATSDELEKMRKGKTREEKHTRFLQFWKSKDPSPNTAKNELMLEYYSRVKIANERYSNYFDGWKSDMGMVYIMYGNPSSIERYPFTQNSKPYEVWDYYDVNRRFIFVDYTGFGDYRLSSPLWEQEHTKAY